MSHRLFALVALLLWVVLIAGGVWLFFSGYTAKAPDGRTEVLLTPPERRMVLREMRQMLGSVQGVVAALAADDTAAAAEAAARSATVQAQPSPTMIARLPQDFMQRGMTVHDAFGALAEAARNGAPENDLQQRLGTILANCVACHAVYAIGPAAGEAASSGTAAAAADTGCAADLAETTGSGSTAPAGDGGDTGCTADLGAVDTGTAPAAQ